MKAEVINFCLWCMCGEEVDQNPETPKFAVGLKLALGASDVFKETESVQIL